MLTASGAFSIIFASTNISLLGNDPLKLFMALTPSLNNNNDPMPIVSANSAVWSAISSALLRSGRLYDICNFTFAPF